jgi:hypothetical protein
VAPLLDDSGLHQIGARRRDRTGEEREGLGRQSRFDEPAFILQREVLRRGALRERYAPGGRNQTRKGDVLSRALV